MIKDHIILIKLTLMKNLKEIGAVLKKSDLKSINGGMHSGDRFVCIENFPFTYEVREGELCDDGSVPLCP